MAFSEYPIHMEQLCVGLWVRSDDSRAFSALQKGFKIKNDDHIEKIQKSGLMHVICALNKSDRLPIPLTSEDFDAVMERPDTQKDVSKKTKTPVSKQLLGLKNETVEKNKERRKVFNKVEKRFDKAVGEVSMLLRRVSGRSHEAVEQALKVVDGLVDTFLSERDVLVNLITNKPQEDRKNLHAMNVCVLSMIMGKELDLDAEAMSFLGMGALFHDIGKGRVPIHEMTRGKPTTMRHAVQRHYEQHPRMGAKIVMDLHGFPKHAAHVILQHHEACDGTGFPNKLPAGKISPLAKILAIANLYDNLCNSPDPDKQLTPHEALKRMYARHKSKLDNRFLATFIRSLGVYPPGSIVQLSNGALGMVISTNVEKSTRPSVLIYHPDVPKKEALVVDLVIEDELEIKKGMRPEDLQREVFSYLSPSRQLSYYADAMGA